MANDKYRQVKGTMKGFFLFTTSLKKTNIRKGKYKYNIKMIKHIEYWAPI